MIPNVLAQGWLALGQLHIYGSLFCPLCSSGSLYPPVIWLVVSEHCPHPEGSLLSLLSCQGLLVTQPPTPLLLIASNGGVSSPISVSIRSGCRPPWMMEGLASVVPVLNSSSCLLDTGRNG
jgi:hypothetical protein